MAHTLNNEQSLGPETACGFGSKKDVAIALGALFIVNLLLRVFYLRYQFVNGDEAVRALTAVRLLEGGRLYIDVITDKPPGATLFYAGIFALAGRSMAAVHLAATLWNFATSLVVFRIAVKLYGRGAALWAAFIFVYFSTNYFTQDVMAANTEILMALPLSGSFYFFISERVSQYARLAGRETTGGPIPRGTISLLMAGLLTGVSVIFKQVAVFNLAFFVSYEVFAHFLPPAGRLGKGDDGRRLHVREIFCRLAIIGAGFAIPLGLLVLWLAASGGLSGFYRNAIVLGAFYVGSLPRALWIRFMFTRTIGYVLFNGALWSLSVWAAWRSVSRLRSSGVTDRTDARDLDPANPNAAIASRYADIAVGLWALVSLSGVFTSGRFYGHYFVQALPALSLLAAHGAVMLRARLAGSSPVTGARVTACFLIIVWLFGFVRFHHRTAVLAYETLTNHETRWSRAWGMSKREREAESIAGWIRGSIGEAEPLYIWGYALDIYWRSRCRPASRYLTPYYVTGHFYPEVSGDPEAPGERFWRQARAQLIDDLTRTRPRLILNIDEPIDSLPYPEVVSFIYDNYEYEGQIGSDPSRPFLVYRLKQAGLRPAYPAKD